MPEVEFERTFQAAHRLANYNGKCARIHGHNFKLRVVIEIPVLDDQGFVIEFEKIKRLVDQFDHMLILSASDDILNPLPVEIESMVCRVPGAPTTEFMAQWFADNIAAMFACVVVRTELRETDSIMARGVAAKP